MMIQLAPVGCCSIGENIHDHQLIIHICGGGQTSQNGVSKDPHSIYVIYTVFGSIWIIS